VEPTEQERERAKVEQGARPGYIAELAAQQGPLFTYDEGAARALEAATLSSDKMQGIFEEITTEGSKRDADHD
jgi:hypothetical protein